MNTEASGMKPINHIPILNILFMNLPGWAEGIKFWQWLSNGTDISVAILKSPHIKDSTVKRGLATANHRAKQRLLDKGLSQEEVNRWLAGAPKEGICSALIYGCQIDGLLAYPHTLEFARQIDLLSSRLLNLRENDDLNGFKNAILDSIVRDPVYFSSNAAIVEQHTDLPYYELFKSATDWYEIREPYLQLMFNTTLSLLAQWDVEFGAQYFKSFEPRPCFAMTLPKLDPATGGIVNGMVAKRRDRFWTPVRRLIDLMACLSEYYRHKRWPKVAPDVKDIAAITNIDEGKDEYNVEDKIENWRRFKKPHRFKHENFIALWSKLCPDKPEPLPLFYATLLWQKLSIHNDSQFLLIDKEYLSWWQWHYDNLMAKGCTFGTAPWPDCFNEL